MALLWTVLGSVAAVSGTVIGILQLRQTRDRRTLLVAPVSSPGVVADRSHGPSDLVSEQIVPASTGDGAAASPDWLKGTGNSDRVPRIWNMRARNRGFTGRDDLLAILRARFIGGHQSAVQVLRGMGGVGKTQAAVEYAYRYASDYDIVWWIAAEQPELIGPQIAGLATELGCMPDGADNATSVRAAMSELRGRDRWLLIFDNAVSPAELSGWLPNSTAGHVLLTSRSGGWHEIAEDVEVDVFDRADSLEVLRTRVPHLTVQDADELAAALGDLPLAVVQAARFLAETGMPPDEYRTLLSTRAAEILGDGRPPSYPLSLAAAIQLARDKLGREEPAAAALLDLCAFMAPENPVSTRLISTAAGSLPKPLASKAADPVALGRLLAAISRSSLARVGVNTVDMHRLTQAVLRDRLSARHAADARRTVESILASNNPRDRTDPAKWPAWADLLPHLLAADPGASSNPDILGLASEAARQLWRRGDTRGTYELASKLYEQWRQRLGDDDPHTLSAVESLGDVAWDQARYADARDLDVDNLARRRRVLGEDHPDTLTSASSLAADLRKLGDFQAARELQQDTLARRRRVLGDDDPDTLHSARDLSAILRELGEGQAARRLDEDTLARSRATVGEDHPDTLTSASNLAVDLRLLGELTAARELEEATLGRRRRALGNDHPDTLWSARDLAAIVRELGDARAARALDEDTLARSRVALGDDHPDTLTSAESLAADLRQLGELQLAEQLEQDTLGHRSRLRSIRYSATRESGRSVQAIISGLGPPGPAREPVVPSN